MSDPADNLPVIPDHVMDDVRKGRDVPLEALSPAAAEMAAETAAAQSRPVHMDALRPISKAQANTLMTGNPQGTIQRGSLPKAPVTRRVIPEPFKRPVINLQIPGEPQKTWQYVLATDIREGDIVPDVGLVLRTETFTRYADAAEQVPIRQDQPEEPGGAIRPVIIKEFSPEDSALLLEAYGSTRVAVGSSVRLHGPETVLELDALEQVRAFRTEGS